jgi:cell division protein FtsQ
LQVERRFRRRFEVEDKLLRRDMQKRANSEGARQKRTRVRMLILGFFLFLGGVMILESPLTRVRELVVTGNASVTEQAILDASDLHKGMSLWQVNAAAIADKVTAAQPRVQSVTVHTDYLTGTVTLSIKEKQIVAVLASSGRFYDLLSDGKVYTQAAANAGFTWPLVTSDHALNVQLGQVPDPAVAVICQQLSQIPQDQANLISEVHLDNFGVATVYLVNHFVAECKDDQFATCMKQMMSAVSYFKGKGYAPGFIDMTGGQPYRYTPFSMPSEGNG